MTTNTAVPADSGRFKALVVRQESGGQSAAFEEMDETGLMEGDVTVAVEYSTVNYKDGLALTGKGPIIRKFPLIPGIDFAGTVEQSGNSRFKPGDRVVLNGFGVGEGHHGGYAARARVKGEWLVKLPESLSSAQAMAIGTAGYTAMLCVMALEKAGIAPANGPVVVTGAAGGVGSVALTLLNRLGYQVVAASRRVAAEGDYLREIGAHELIDSAELMGTEPLGKARWGAGIDTVGSRILAGLLSQIKYDGAVACCGLAQGADLPASVFPFILRGVSLLGVDSVMAPLARREEAWRRLATDLDLEKLAQMTTEIALEDVPAAAQDIVAGKVRGRLAVRVA